MPHKTYFRVAKIHNSMISHLSSDKSDLWNNMETKVYFYNRMLSYISSETYRCINISDSTPSLHTYEKYGHIVTPVRHPKISSD